MQIVTCSINLHIIAFDHIHVCFGGFFSVSESLSAYDIGSALVFRQVLVDEFPNMPPNGITLIFIQAHLEQQLTHLRSCLLVRYLGTLRPSRRTYY